MEGVVCFGGNNGVVCFMEGLVFSSLLQNRKQVLLLSRFTINFKGAPKQGVQRDMSEIYNIGKQKAKFGNMLVINIKIATIIIIFFINTICILMIKKT